MALNTRAKAFVGVSVVVVLLAAAALGYFLLTGGAGPLGGIIGGGGRPKICPLTGTEPASGRNVPQRGTLAVKIENISVSRPQIGLLEADIVYEEPVEGGITRFFVVYQCRDAQRLGPVRSARTVDRDLLLQFGRPIFAYSGGVAPVKQAIQDAGIRDVNFDEFPDPYEEDPNRSPPHNLFSSTRILYRAGGRGEAPEPIFAYDPDRPAPGASRRAREIHVNYSPESDVFWRFRRGQGGYLRFHGTEPHTMEDGSQVSVTNVVVQVVDVRLTGARDPAGNPVPEVSVIGRGDAFVFRNGRVIEGRWLRPSREEVTQLVDRQGNEIALAPGTTWVQLFPKELVDEGRLDFG